MWFHRPHLKSFMVTMEFYKLISLCLPKYCLIMPNVVDVGIAVEILYKLNFHVQLCDFLIFLQYKRS